MQDEQRNLLDVLPILLQHRCTHQAAVLCKLLASSKALATAVASLCREAVAVKACKSPPAAVSVFENQHLILLDSICSWIRQHGSLMTSLDLQLANWSGTPKLAAALHAAAAEAPSGLLELQSFKVSHVTREMLEQLSPQHLQSLFIDFFLDDDSLEEASQLLPRFTTLQRLHLKMGADPAVLQSVLPALTNLQTLQIGSGPAMDLGKLVQWIPANGQLQDLEVLHLTGCCHMGHLTALTAIRSAYYGLQVQDGDVLPPMLQEVAVVCTSLQPLLQLQYLRDLRLGLERNRGSLVLQQLSSNFTGLTALKLSVCHSLLLEWHHATDGRWKHLPLSDLNVFFIEFPEHEMSDGLQLLVGLTQLTKLHLVADRFAGISHDAAHVLQQLTSLRWLHLGPLCEDSSLELSELLVAFGTLPQLQQLHLKSNNALTDALALHLSRLTSLTALSLHSFSSADDVELSVQALMNLTSLTGLRSLSLRACAGVCDDVIMTLFASSLQHLTKLDLAGTEVTVKGVQCLTSLRNLQRLDVPYHIQ